MSSGQPVLDLQGDPHESKTLLTMLDDDWKSYFDDVILQWVFLQLPKYPLQNYIFAKLHIAKIHIAKNVSANIPYLPHMLHLTHNTSHVTCHM